jgi:siroheme synthase-like protein
MSGYSIELDLRGQTVLIVGLGTVGRRKAAGLIAAGARVVAVDPAARLKDIPEGVEVRAEAYQAEHLFGVRLAFAAGPPDVNAQVVADAKEAKVWVNVANNSNVGDFTVPAVWCAEGLKLTVSTSGASPALAAALRDCAVEALGHAAPGLVALLGELRPSVLTRLSDPEARRRVLADLANPRWLNLFAAEGPEAVREEMRRIIEREDERGREAVT